MDGQAGRSQNVRGGRRGLLFGPCGAHGCQWYPDQLCTTPYQLRGSKARPQIRDTELSGTPAGLGQLSGEAEVDELVASGEIRGLSVSATCSVVVMSQGEGVDCSGGDAPERADDEGTHTQDIIFWMDTRSSKQTREINELANQRVKERMGGCFVEEMAITKVKYMLDHAEEEGEELDFEDLHTYVSRYLQERWGCNDLSYTSGQAVALDGEVHGWDQEFLDSINVKMKGRPVPLAGTPIARGGSLTISQGVIDSYGSWLGSCGQHVGNTLTLVAGTSTCFMLPHSLDRPIKGVWGPFEGIFDHLFVSTGGYSTTGKLIEHLFETHPAFKELESMGNVFDSLEVLIQEMEEDESVHYKTKYKFLYGDLAGNRTPYADASMRGVYFGESTDTSLTDLVHKYVCILEFLAFQTKQTLSLITGVLISKISICGSQARNLRLVRLISMVTGLPVEVNTTDPQLSGVRGAAYLAYSGANNVPLIDVIEKFNLKGKTFDVHDKKLDKLLQEKYKIMLDIAKSQLDYKERIDRISH